MEIILSPRCKSFTGTISRYHGYAVRQSGKRFFSYRTPGKYAKPDGHWQFIVSCAELAKNGFMLSDIKVTYKELKEAIVEAKIPGLYLYRLKDVYDADDILTIKSKCGL